MNFENVIFAFALTLFAGLSTGIGSVLSLFAKRTNTRFLSFSLGFSAGVMLYVSFVEILAKASDSLTSFYGERSGAWLTAAAFFGGIAVIALIDKFIPKMGNPHSAHTIEEMDGMSAEHRTKLMRMGVFMALAISLHNFPEGLATFIAALTDQSLGIPVAFAVAIHNIPEGIAVAVPIFYATGSRKKAFRLSFLSGLSEPVGALVGYLILLPFMSDALMGFVFASVAGIMVFISLDELLPSAEEYGEHHFSIGGVVLGMVVMSISLLLFV